MTRSKESFGSFSGSPPRKYWNVSTVAVRACHSVVMGIVWAECHSIPSFVKTRIWTVSGRSPSSRRTLNCNDLLPTTGRNCGQLKRDHGPLSYFSRIAASVPSAPGVKSSADLASPRRSISNCQTAQKRDIGRSSRMDGSFMFIVLYNNVLG